MYLLPRHNNQHPFAMQFSRILIPGAWLLSLVAAFIIGRKTETSPADNPSSSTHKNSSYSSCSSASRRGGSDTSPTSRKKSTIRHTKNSRSARHLDITAIATNEDPITRSMDLIKLIDTLGPNDFLQVVADFRSSHSNRKVYRSRHEVVDSH